MNILLNIFLKDLWFLIYRECPYSGTVRIQLLSPIYFVFWENKHNKYK